MDRLPRLRTTALLLAASLLVASCRNSGGPFNLSRLQGDMSGNSAALTEAQLQSLVRRLTAHYITRMAEAADKASSLTEDPKAKSLAHKLKLTQLTAVVEIALGPSALVNLLDLFVQARLTRESQERYWGPNVFGAAGEPIIAASRMLEEGMRVELKRVLTQEQLAQVDGVVQAWIDQHPEFRYVGFTRLSELALDVHPRGEDQRKRNTSFFSMLYLDPFASLDPTMRQVAEAAAMADNVVYLMQQLPILLRMNIEQLSMDLFESEGMKTTLDGMTRLSFASESLAATAASLPGKLEDEREALVAALESSEGRLKELSSDVRETVKELRGASDSLDRTFLSFDGILKRFGVGEPKEEKVLAPGEEAKPSEPFRILDYAKTAQDIEAAAGRLTLLIEKVDASLEPANLERLASQASPVVADVRSGTEALVETIFKRACILLGILAASVASWIVLHHLLKARRVAR